MMRGVSRKVIFLLVFISFVFIACSERPASEQKQEKTISSISIRLSSPITSTDPIRVVDANTLQVIYNAYSHLFKMLEDGSIIKDLVESYEKKENGRIWILKLKRGIKFCKSGDEVLADDVIFSLQRAYEDPYSKVSWVFKDLKSIQKIDNYTVMLTFSTPLDLPKYLTLPQLAIVRPYKENALDSAGPYYIKEVKETELILEKCPTGSLKATFDKVTFKVIPNEKIAIAHFKSKKVSLTEIDPTYLPYLQQDNELKAYIREVNDSANFYFIAFNTQKLDKALRKYLVAVVDKQQLCSQILNGICYPENFVSSINSKLSPDYLVLRGEGGKISGFEKKKMELLVVNTPLFITTAEYVAKQWKDSLGIDTNIRILSFKSLISIVFSGQDFDAVVLWVSPLANLLEIWHLLWNPLDSAPPHGRNACRYFNKEYLKLFKLYKQESSMLDNVDFLKEIEKVLEEDPPAVPLYSVKTVWLSRVKNVPLGRFKLIRLWQ